MKHVLKIFERHYLRVKDGTKTFEIRENDRAFQMGDTVELVAYDNNGEKKVSYWITSEERTSHPDLIFKIGCVYPIDDKRVVFSLLEIK